MSDPQEELGKRFDDRRADGEDEDEDSSPDITETGGKGGTSDSDDADNTGDADNTSDAASTTRQSAGESASEKPGPDPSPDSTRNRQQVPMYLPDEMANQLDSLYELLDGRSKIAGNGGIEKHADFMEAAVTLVIDSEDELAMRLGIEDSEE